MTIEIDHWIVCVQGFGGTEGRMSGIVRIQDDIHERCSGQRTRVLLKNWQDSPSAVADRIMHRRPSRSEPKIVLIGHSYGGYTVNEIARQLGNRGLGVDYLMLLDAVWRPTRLLPSFLSLLPWWSIKVPDNVRCLLSWRQQISRPSGHRLVVPKRTIHEDHTVNVRHTFVDDLPAVHDTALRISCTSKQDRP